MGRDLWYLRAVLTLFQRVLAKFTAGAKRAIWGLVVGHKIIVRRREDQDDRR